MDVVLDVYTRYNSDVLLSRRSRLINHVEMSLFATMPHSQLGPGAEESSCEVEGEEWSRAALDGATDERPLR